MKAVVSLLIAIGVWCGFALGWWLGRRAEPIPAACPSLGAQFHDADQRCRDLGGRIGIEVEDTEYRLSCRHFQESVAFKMPELER